MSDVDRIVGIAVLQPIWVPGVYRLWFVALKAAGSRAQGWIFIRDGKMAGPDEVVGYGANRNAIWKFSQAAVGVLDCWPSVNWLSWEFHNVHNWSVEYVQMARLDEKAGEVAREHRGSAVHHDLNFVELDEQTIRREWQMKFIAELRAKGILLPAQ